MSFSSALRVVMAAVSGILAVGWPFPSVAEGDLKPVLPMTEITFASIDGGTLPLGDWLGRPVLVVNTASRCAFTRQYSDLQALYDRYRARGLVVLAVPSDDFRQELGTDAEVKEFCELNYDLDLPMSEITHVVGPAAHPFYQQVAQVSGFTPRWNFNKILIGPRGDIIATYGATLRPTARKLTRAVEAALTQ
ncbi:MAG: glutathione peroxidase [Paracoccaceae bacterium]|jgi:glutathione peroxidase